MGAPVGTTKLKRLLFDRQIGLTVAVASAIALISRFLDDSTGGQRAWWGCSSRTTWANGRLLRLSFSLHVPSPLVGRGPINLAVDAPFGEEQGECFPIRRRYLWPSLLHVSNRRRPLSTTGFISVSIISMSITALLQRGDSEGSVIVMAGFVEVVRYG